jgi:hypothetical protein
MYIVDTGLLTQVTCNVLLTRGPLRTSRNKGLATDIDTKDAPAEAIPFSTTKVVPTDSFP